MARSSGLRPISALLLTRWRQHWRPSRNNARQHLPFEVSLAFGEYLHRTDELPQLERLEEKRRIGRLAARRLRSSECLVDEDSARPQRILQDGQERPMEIVDDHDHIKCRRGQRNARSFEIDYLACDANSQTIGLG